MSLSTPWGKAQQQKTVAPGVISVSTASHGGYLVNSDAAAKMPSSLRAIGMRWHNWLAFEEDCDWCAVLLSFPQINPDHADQALSTLKNWHPDTYTAWSGKPLAPEDSMMLREKMFKEKTRLQFVCVAAWGDWCATVPTGFIGICARRESDQAEVYRLIPDKDYTPPYVLTGTEREWTGPK